jgi:hypothetical protein
VTISFASLKLINGLTDPSREQESFAMFEMKLGRRANGPPNAPRCPANALRVEEPPSKAGLRNIPN